MPRISGPIALLTVAMLVLMPAPAAAQWAYAGVGPTFPSGDYGDVANTGYMVNLGYGYDVTSTISFGAEGFYGANGHDDGGLGYDNSTALYGGMFFVQSTPLTSGRLAPHAVGGLGLLIADFSSDLLDDAKENGIAWMLGAGFSYGTGESWGLWGDVRYTSAEIANSNTAFFSLVGGLYFVFGSSDYTAP
jgi:hypothetical protein